MIFGLLGQLAKLGVGLGANSMLLKFSRSAESDADWEHIAPHLDDALGELSEPDRDALLLRYFERKSASEMAQTLGISDEAAQKRVSRAVERLREYFAKHGITVGTSGLVVVITANAVQAAPVGLAVTISTAVALAGTTITATTTATAAKAIAMTTLQKTIIGVTLAAAVGTGIFEARQASTARDELQILQQQQASLAEQIRQLLNEKNSASNRLSMLADELERAKGNSSELLRLRAEVTRLQRETDAVTSESNEAKNFQSAVMQIFSNTPPIRTFVATITTFASWNQAIVTGGWMTPSGKRAIVLVTLQPGDAAERITINSKVLEYTKEAGERIGLAQFNFVGRTNGGQPDRPEAHMITAEQSEAILKAAEDSEGVELTAGSVLMASGGQAAVSTLESHRTPSGENYSTGPTLNFLPIISSDGQSVQMVITAQLNYLLPVPLH